MKKSGPTKSILLAVVLLLPVGLLCLPMRAHGTPGGVDLTFDAGSGINNEVRLIAVQPDGKIVIAGEFSMVRGLERHCLARLNRMAK